MRCPGVPAFSIERDRYMYLFLFMFLEVIILFAYLLLKHWDTGTLHYYLHYYYYYYYYLLTYYYYTYTLYSLIFCCPNRCPAPAQRPTKIHCSGRVSSSSLLAALEPLLVFLPWSPKIPVRPIPSESQSPSLADRQFVSWT